ncbi:hypothetical protein GUITHDRAFT_110982 [Guillardia theta CCMP2712]|uniref:Potassium channel domain-containing protein n=1 Tax=Guillardia theta (strain CCMP2712) TaxID=905079 RepID=L1J355_GUITC|nr:hypothetical protein GUITHDRAFT_110982 [Guillardia theta CCMP2712]EKX42936.1 hypothetical protein GUITHDRAFT_110982 [Guillardia theta CCMP2712]|eukprot:XP_005829916.1 hypothetical protein GUITHDRAFT_110982 [Guillardia theta CCMP2712]
MEGYDWCLDGNDEQEAFYFDMDGQLDMPSNPREHLDQIHSLAVQNYIHTHLQRRWWQKVCSSPEIGGFRQGRWHLIHPDSYFSILAFVVRRLVLAYTMIATPLMVAFYWKLEGCSNYPTIQADVFCDAFFLVDIVLHCFTGRNQVLDSWNPIPQNVLSLLRYFLWFTFLVHITACITWVIKLVSTPEEEVEDFLKRWICNNNHRCGSSIGYVPCPSCDDQFSLWHRYVLIIYFVNTIFTSVGFGDLSPRNSDERLFTIVTLYTGTIMFATILSEVENIIDYLREFSRRHAYRLQEGDPNL